MTEGALAVAPEGDDGLDRGGGPAAHYVEPFYGAEVMKPLATPVLGDGQPLMHVLVTPVIFYWLRERELRREERRSRRADRPPRAAGARVGRWTHVPTMTERRNT